MHFDPRTQFNGSIPYRMNTIAIDGAAFYVKVARTHISVISPFLAREQNAIHTEITSLRKQAIQYSIETTYVLTQLRARDISTRKCARVLSIDMHAKWK
jgi:hypothetical protein